MRKDDREAPYIDGSVYPDVEPPEALETDEAKADYVERVCGAWDFDIPPEPETLALFRGWKPVFDRYALPHSPAYHAFRWFYGWEDVPFPENVLTRTPAHEMLDRLEGRGPDPCEGLV